MSHWKHALLASLVVAFIVSIPQLYLCYERGSNWHGGYAYFDADEFGYEAYLQSIIDGQGRRADPYTGKTSSGETLYSIQFVPPYTLSILGRLGLTSSTIFVVLVPLVAFASGLLIFLLIYDLTGNQTMAAIGVLGVLLLGAVAAVPIPGLAQKAQRGFGYFPFLRRFLPSFPFVLLLLLTLTLWRSLTRSLGWAIICGFCFVLLVFSYFFLWTAALAWITCTLGLWFVFQDRSRVLKVCAVLMPFGLCLIPWAWLVSRRPLSFDGDQVLRLTHALDLVQTSEALGVILLIVIGLRRGWKDPRLVFGASFALTPILIFNQQLITGRTLQPFHYSQFVTNYWIVLTVFILLGFWRTMPKRVPLYFLTACLTIGLMLSVRAAKTSFEVSERIDQAQALKKKLGAGVVFSPNIALMYALPGPTQPLWAQHSYTFANLSLAEQRHRFFEYLYYQDLPIGQVRLALEKDFTSRVEVFGSDRANELLSMDHKPITEAEISEAVLEYEMFCKTFKLTVPLSYAIVAPQDKLTKLDLWYDRDGGERFEDLTIYRLKLRNAGIPDRPSTTLSARALAAQKK